MLGRIAHDLAKLAALANIRHHLGDHLRRVEENAISFRTVHDAEATALLRHTFFIGHYRDIIHAPPFPSFTPPRPSIRRDSSLPTPRPYHRLSSRPPGSWRATAPS